MTATNVTPISPRQRNPLDFSLLPAEEARRDGLIRERWCAIVDGFACRPAPRRVWDRAADGTEARWKKLLDPMRLAVVTAVYIGDQRLIEQTMEGVRDFLRAIEADVASFIPPREEESVTTLALLETEECGKAKVEEARLLAHPSPIEATRAISPLLKEESALARLLSGVQRLARQPQMRIAR